MIWNCSICISRMEGNKDGSCTPCGHVFHSECLAKWLPTKNTCPVCRLKVHHAIKLYPSLSVDDDSLVAKDEMEKKVIEINQLKAQIDVLNRNAATADHLVKHLNLQNMMAETKLQEANNENKKVFMELETTNFEKMKALTELQYTKFEKLEARNKLEVANLKLRNMKDLEQQFQNLKISFARATEELSFLNHIRTLVNGQQQDVEQILMEVQSSASAGIFEQMESVKKLANFCSILKQDLIKINAEKNYLSDALVLFKTEFMITHRNIQ